jgi:esterase/lipase superfamily enzyme
MYVVSCRSNFTSDETLGKQNRYRNYTNPQNADAFQELNLDDILARATDKHVCILVHGYNNSIPAVMKSYWEIVSQSSDTGVIGPKGYGLVVGFTWPGMSSGIGYFAARSTAKKAAPFLLEVINNLRTVAHSVDVQTHSLGARVALTALANPKKVFVDNLLLTAPAVDNDLLEPEQDFHPSLDSCNRCFVYHSKNDSVLKITYPLGDIADGMHKALGLNGPRSKPVTLSKCLNVYVVDCSARVKDHGGYRKTVRYFDHWNEVLSGTSMSRYDELS